MGSASDVILFSQALGDGGVHVRSRGAGRDLALGGVLTSSHTPQNPCQELPPRCMMK